LWKGSAPLGVLTCECEELQSLNLEDVELIAKELEDLKANPRANEVLNGAMGPSGKPLVVNPIQMVLEQSNEPCFYLVHGTRWFKFQVRCLMVIIIGVLYWIISLSREWSFSLAI